MFSYEIQKVNGIKQISCMSVKNSRYP